MTDQGSHLYRHLASCGRSRQQGMALLVSLVLLVISSLLAVATLSGTRLSERVAGNEQQKSIAFEAAESAVEQGYQIGVVQMALPPSIVDRATSRPVEIADINTRLSTDYDQFKTAPNGREVQFVDIEGSLTVQYCGEFVLPEGTDLSVNLDDSSRKTGLMFDINSVVAIDGDAASSDHMVRGYFAGPATGQTGSCVSR